MNYDITSIKSIEQHAKLLIGNSLLGMFPLYQFDKNSGNKGGIGQLIETLYFEKKLDNESAPDFPEAGVELKVTPIKRLNNGEIRAKERLVLNIINYLKIIDENWENSSFIHKNSLILLIFYLHEKEKLSIEYIIKIVELFSFKDFSEDYNIIKNDWLTIQKKIKDGKAHELSEGDTEYLGACTKGSTAEKSLREQPNSEILAKQRAFSFKQGYVNYILKRLEGENPGYEKLFKNTEEKGFDFKKELENLFQPFIGKTALEIGEQFDFKFTGQKNYYAVLSNKIMGINQSDKIEEFNKANIKLKTIRITPNGKLKEDISFPTFKFKELIQEHWEDSELYNLLESQKFFFVIYKITAKSVTEFNQLPDIEKNKFLVLDKVVLWNTPGKDIEEKAQRTWNKTIKIIQDGVIITKKGDKFYNNLPSASETNMIHVRPHAINRDDVDELPDGRKLTKQCFWFNRDYIKKELGI